LNSNTYCIEKNETGGRLQGVDRKLSINDQINSRLVGQFHPFVKVPLTRRFG